jgi:hypothetical protein
MMVKRVKVVFIGVVVIIVIVLGIIGMVTNKTDHDDGKCDICGKAAAYSGADEEYCDEHLMDAAEWYIEQSEK